MLSLTAIKNLFLILSVLGSTLYCAYTLNSEGSQSSVHVNSNQLRDNSALQLGNNTEEGQHESLSEIELNFNQKKFKKTYSLLTNKIKRLSSSEKMILGYLYLHGYGVKQNYKAARKWLGYSVAEENIESYALLGFLYERGYGVKVDYDEALRLYQIGAVNDDPLAMNNLGHLFEQGHGVKEDKSLALSLYQKAADLGNTLAMNNLGCSYLIGNGIIPRPKTGLLLLQKAADKNEIRAMRNLEAIFKEGLQVTKNLEISNQWKFRADTLEAYYKDFIKN